MADAMDAQRLRIAPGRPVLLVESIDVATSGEPLSTKRTRFAADRVELLVESSSDVVDARCENAYAVVDPGRGPAGPSHRRRPGSCPRPGRDDQHRSDRRGGP